MRDWANHSRTLTFKRAIQDWLGVKRTEISVTYHNDEMVIRWTTAPVLPYRVEMFAVEILGWSL